MHLLMRFSFLMTHAYLVLLDTLHNVNCTALSTKLILKLLNMIYSKALSYIGFIQLKLNKKLRQLTRNFSMGGGKCIS